ncbi:hypothetical protein ACWNT8_04800 [Pigmentibacter ruber]
MLKSKLGTYFVTLSFLSLLYGCAQGGGSGGGGSSGNTSGDITVKQSADASDNIKKLAVAMDPYLGKGYNSLLGMNTKGFCLGNVAAKFTAKRQNITKFDKIDSLETLFNNNNFSFSRSVGLSFGGEGISGFLGGLLNSLPGVNTSLGFGLSSAFNFSSYTTNMLMVVKNIAGSRQMNVADKSTTNYVINPQYANLTTNQFAVLCGDGVITEQSAESNLYFALKFAFANTATKNSFDLSFGLGGKIPIPDVPGMTASFDFKAMFGNVNQTTRANTNLTIYAMQVGGDSTKLPNALKNGLSCNLANEKGCSDLFSTINDYIAVKYPAQFSENDLKALEKNPEDSKYVLSTSQISSYAELPIFDKEKFVSQDIASKLSANIDLKNQIKNKTSLQISNYFYVLNLANSDNYRANLLAKGEKDMILNNLVNMNNTFTKLISIIDVCYDNIDKCLSDVSNIFTPGSMYKPMDEDVRKIVVDSKIIGRTIKSDLSASSEGFLTPTQLQGYDTIIVKIVTTDGLVVNLNPIPNVNIDPNQALAILTCSAEGKSQSTGNMTIYTKNFINIKATDFVWKSGKSAKDYSTSKICRVDSQVLTKFTNPVAVEVWGMNTFAGIP